MEAFADVKNEEGGLAVVFLLTGTIVAQRP